jgi:hypothetical protein
MVRNQTLLSSQLPSLLSSQVEKFSAKKYDENGEKQRMGMLSVLEMLREKCFPYFRVMANGSGYRPWGTLA